MRVAPAPLAALLAAILSASACAPNRGAAFDKAMADARRAHNAGRFALAAERFDEAARAANLPRDSVYARYEAALARARAGDAARASAELRAIAAATPPSAYSAQAAFKAADLTAKSDAERGDAELEAVAVRFPESGVARAAVLRIVRRADERGAAEALARLEGLAPRVSGTALEEVVAYERAKRLAELGRLEVAREAFLDVAARWPYPRGAYFDDALYRASEIEEALGRHREAIALLERMLSFRERASTMGSYERPRYVPAMLRIATLYEERLGDRAKAREALHRLYRDFETSILRDDALWREAELWEVDGDGRTACARLALLVADFPDSRYVPCAVDRCASVERPTSSKAPDHCRAYLTRKAYDEDTP